jgi:predicted phosphohydrolase
MMDISTIVWANDLHLSFPDTGSLSKLWEKINNSGADILLVAGDISNGMNLEQYLLRLNEEIKIPIYFVLGNHDFYYSNIQDTSKLVTKLCRDNEKLHWLNNEGVVELDKDVALIGHDGWYDAKAGNINGGVILNDFRMVDDLKPLFLSGNIILVANRCGEIAKKACDYIEKVLTSAVSKYKNIIFVTHVPPYEKAAWHAGGISEPSYLPWFACPTMGETLNKVMVKHPDKELIVLCGHTHGGGEYQAAPNIKVITGKAEYYSPDIQDIIDLWEIADV